MPEEFIDPSTLIGRQGSDPLVQEFIARCKLVEWDEVEESEEMRVHREWCEKRDAASFAEMTEEEQRRYLEVRKEQDAIRDEWADLLLTDSNEGRTQMKLIRPERNAPRIVDNIEMRPGSLSQLPFGLQPNVDLSEFTVGRLIDKSKMTCEGVVSHWRGFLHGNLSIALCFDEPALHFSWLSIAAVAPHELARLRFHDGLAAQKPNLVANVAPLLEQWQKSSPIHLWQKRMQEGDSIFNETNLRLADEELNMFFMNIEQAVKKRAPKQIINALKKSIKNLNRLSRKHGNFIETTEREELAPFLQNIVSATGLQFEEGFDVTLEWRDW
jgi:hypothetical protein